jgi:hypothetical protein
MEETRKMRHKSKFICKSPMESLFSLRNMSELLRNLTELHMPLHRGERLTASSICDVIGDALAQCVVASLPLRR